MQDDANLFRPPPAKRFVPEELDSSDAKAGPTIWDV